MATTDIHIINNQQTHILKERNYKKEWDDRHTQTDNDIESFEIVPEEEKWQEVHLTVPFEIDPDKVYYLLSVIYSSGDSFNRNDGKIHYIELYEDSKLATTSKAMIEKDNKNKDSEDRYNVKIFDANNNIYTVSASWKGYFEHLEEVRIDRVYLKL